MIRIAVCDDEVCFLQGLKNRLHEINKKKSLHIKFDFYEKGALLLEDNGRERFDAVFLDVKMKGMSGMEVAEALRKNDENVMIIFISNYDEEVFHSFPYRPFGFIRKSHMEEELEKNLLAVVHNCREEHLPIRFATPEGRRIFRLNEISYFDVYDHNVVLHTGKKSTRITGTLTECENQLRDKGFIRIHKSYMVNYRHISHIGVKSVFLQDGRELPLSRHRIKEVKEQMMEFAGSEWNVEKQSGGVS